MKATALVLFTLFTLNSFAQSTLNAYKYVLVPERFAFSHEDNQYGLATITKLQLEDKGFIAFRDKDPLPPALAANKCLALKAEVDERKTLFSTNLTLYLKDCQGNTIFKGREGKSREKEFEDAYPEALAAAFASLQNTPYKYDSTLMARTQQPVAAPPSGQTAPTPPPTPPSGQTAPTSPSGQATAASPTPENPPTPVTPEAGIPLYAQPIPNGYQLIDTTPKKVLTLLKTSQPDYFIANTGSSNGIVYKKDGAWYYEYYKNEKLVSQHLEIKF